MLLHEHDSALATYFMHERWQSGVCWRRGTRWTNHRQAPNLAMRGLPAFGIATRGCMHRVPGGKAIA